MAMSSTGIWGPATIADAFRLSRNTDPKAKLHMNEELESFSDERAEAFFKLTQQLKQTGVPIDGLSLQSYFGFSVPSLDEFRRYLERMTAMGLEVEITELDARLALFRSAPDPYHAQAKFYGRMLRICVENPDPKGMTFGASPMIIAGWIRIRRCFSSRTNLIY